MIIFEGSDNLGKTVAATKVAEVAGLQLCHMGIPPPGWDYFGDFLNILNARQRCVQDRFHLGGLVYGKWLGLHQQTVQYATYALLAQRLKEHGCITIVFYASDDTWYEERLLAAEDRPEAFDIDRIMAANALFRGLSSRFADWQ